ncbi:MAG: hypothetical protein WA210_03845, partial [Burkholderiaceae bacterium]
MSRTARPCSTLFICLAALATSTAVDTAKAAGADTGVIVNGVELRPQTLAALMTLYPVPIAPGRYWYDPASGAYGVEGGAVAGQMLAGLRLGGALR